MLIKGKERGQSIQCCMWQPYQDANSHTLFHYTSVPVLRFVERERPGIWDPFLGSAILIASRYSTCISLTLFKLNEAGMVRFSTSTTPASEMELPQ